MWGWHDGWSVGGWFGMGLMMVAFWVLVIWAIVALVRTTGRPSEPPRTQRGPEDVLAERFASGEIDESEYETRLRSIRAHQRSGTG